MNADITALQTSKDQSEEACNQENTGLNAEITALQKSKADCENRVKELQRNFDEADVNAKNSVDVLGTKISGLQQQLSTAESDLSAMEENH